MGVNKVIYDGTTLIDITDTTAVAGDVAQGKKIYGANGNAIIGTATGGGGNVYHPTVTLRKWRDFEGEDGVWSLIDKDSDPIVRAEFAKFLDWFIDEFPDLLPDEDWEAQKTMAWSAILMGYTYDELKEVYENESEDWFDYLQFASRVCSDMEYPIDEYFSIDPVDSLGTLYAGGWVHLFGEDEDPLVAKPEYLAWAEEEYNGGDITVAPYQWVNKNCEVFHPTRTYQNEVVSTTQVAYWFGVESGYEEIYPSYAHFYLYPRGTETEWSATFDLAVSPDAIYLERTDDEYTFMWCDCTFIIDTYDRKRIAFVISYEDNPSNWTSGWYSPDSVIFVKGGEK